MYHKIAEGIIIPIPQPYSQSGICPLSKVKGQAQDPSALAAAREDQITMSVQSGSEEFPISPWFHPEKP